MNRWTRLSVVVLAVGMLAFGCNIFESLAPSQSADDYIADGRSALQDGNYDLAIENFNKAAEEDPTDARAQWGLAKAYVRRSGYTSISIMTELSKFGYSGFGTQPLPFMEDPLYRVDGLYTGLIEANKHLKMIHDGFAWSTELDGDAVALDYTGTLAVQGILLFRDTNGDGHIDGNDFNLAAFYQDGQFTLGNLSDPTDPNAWLTYYQSNPTAAEDMLNNAVDILGESSGVLMGIYSDITGDSLSTGIDTENLDTVITDLLTGLLNNYNPTNP